MFAISSSIYLLRYTIFKHDPKGKVAEAYKVLTKEVLNNAEKRRKHQLEGVR